MMRRRVEPSGLRSAASRLGRTVRKLPQDLRGVGVLVDSLARPHRSTHGLVILDDIFPHFLSAFRIAEYNRYLTRWNDAVAYTTCAALRAVGDRGSFVDVHRNYAVHHPLLAQRVFHYHRRRRVRGKLAYTVFVNNAHFFLKYMQRRELPFVFTLYPGGGFELDQDHSDLMLRRVCSSPMFHGVICTQRVTRDYLIDRGFCGPEHIEYVYGGVFPSDRLMDKPLPRKRYGVDKPALDLCFVAMKYTPAGRDKGYDTFIDVARRLARAHEDVAFHVVGPFDESDLDVRDLEGRLTFYGPKPTDFFPEFYSRMDIILSPNVPFLVLPGSFDGFPTGCCIEAGLCGTAVLCTDPLKLNESFRDGEELLIVPAEPSAIVESIERLRDDPDRLARLGEAGQGAFQRVFDIEAQLAPRLRLLERYIDT